MNCYNIKGDIVGSMQLDASVFKATPNQHVIHELVVAELASARQGTASTKTRAEVSGGGRKPRKQKGTGAARQGSIRSPQWVGGGIAHGPKPRDFSKKMNKKAKKLALRSILSMKVESGDIFILSEYDLAKPKTKDVKYFMEKLGITDTLFLVDDIFSENVVNFYYSARNIKKTTVIDLIDLAAYWLLKYKNIVATKDAITRLEEVLK